MRLWVRGAALSFFLILLVGSGVPLCAQASLQRGPLAGPGAAAGLPQTGDRAAWLRWREQRLARIPARQTGALSAKDATAAGGSGVIETIAGAVPFQTPITALQAGIGSQGAVAEDANGNLFVSATDLGVVLKVDTLSNVTVYAGQPLASGLARQGGDGGLATAAQLVFPFGLAVDTSGNLYIADIGSYTVRMVNAATGIISTVAGVAGEQSNGSSSGPAAMVPLSFPESLALDGNGNLYISGIDTIDKLNLASATLSPFAGEFVGTPCLISKSVSCPASSLDFLAFGIGVIAVGNGNLYLATSNFNGQESQSGIISVGLSSGTAQLIFSESAPPPSYDGPSMAVSADASGNLDIADAPFGYIRQMTPGGAVTIIAGNGLQVYAGDGGAALSASLINPGAISVSPQGKVLILDTSRIRAISNSGIISTVAGDGYGNLFGNGGPAPAAGIDGPSGSAIDGQGNFYFADAGNHVVRMLSGTTSEIKTIAGDGAVLGSQQGGSDPANNGNGGPALKAAISSATDLALDNAGNLYVGGGQGIRVVNLATGAITTLSEIDEYGGMAFDGAHTLYAASFVTGSGNTGTYWQVIAFDLSNGTSAPVAGGGDSPPDNGVPALSAQLRVGGLSLDAAGNLYISDLDTNAVEVVNLKSGTINNFAGGGLAQFGFGDGGPALAANLQEPQGLGFDGQHLLIADSGHNLIRSIDLSTGIITTVGGNGATGFLGDGGSALQAYLYDPLYVTPDRYGNLFISDNGNDRIRRVVLHPTALTSALAASATSIAAGTSVTFTATYSGLQYGYGPTGTVMFLDGTTAIGTGTVTAAANGVYVATLTESSLAAGMHSITAQYAGDTNYAANTSAAVVLTVTAPPPPPSFSVAATPAFLSLAQGASGTAVFAVTPVNGFNAAVSFSCGSGLPTGVSCSFSPASVTASGTAAVTSTLTITTTGATAAARLQTAASAARWWMTGSGAFLACGLLLWPVRRRKLVWQALCLAGALVMMGGLGCGGNGGGGTNPNETPVGSYTLTVNASAGTAAAGQTANFSLTVTQ